MARILILFLLLSSQGFSQILIAHRGGVVDSTRAENSLPAIEEAIRQGYTGVEIDMRLDKDSVLIIQHDKTPENRGSKAVTLEAALQHCEGKLQVMLDNKIEGYDSLLFARVVMLLQKYHLQETAWMIGTDESTPYFTGKIKLSCTRKQLEENKLKPGYKPSDYYLFGNVHEITAADVKWATQQGIIVLGAVNAWSYKNKDTYLKDAARDIKLLQQRGVKNFQIDSELAKLIH
jgi:glycerophosphoryl diester phosphodiesterase